MKWRTMTSGLASHPETKVEHSVLLVDALPGVDHLGQEGLDDVQVARLEDVVLGPGAEDLEGPAQTAAHLLLAEELDFGTEAALGPGGHAVVDGVGGALLQAVHSHRLPCVRETERERGSETEATRQETVRKMRIAQKEMREARGKKETE